MDGSTFLLLHRSLGELVTVEYVAGLQAKVPGGLLESRTIAGLLEAKVPGGLLESRIGDE